MAFDPNKPFEVLDEKQPAAFDPSQPFEVLDEEQPSAFDPSQPFETIESPTAEDPYADIAAERNDATPIQKRLLEFRHDVTKATGPDDALIQRRDSLEKTLSLFRPDVDKEMQPTWEALAKTAAAGGYFEGKQAVRGPAKELLYGHGIRMNRIEYEFLRDKMARDFNLSKEEADDLVKHRMGAQKELVSRDAAGNVHIKDELLARGDIDLQAAIIDSKLPDKIKANLRVEAPLRIAAFKERMLATVKQDHPELAATLKFTGDIEKDYTTLTSDQNKTRSSQFGGGVAAAAAGRGKLLGTEYGFAEMFGDKGPGSDIKVKRDESGKVVGMEKPKTLYKRGAENEKRLQSINQLSNQINQEKVRLLGTDASVIGQGVASGMESVALGMILPPIGTMAISADRINKAGRVGKILLGAAQRGLNTTPIASLYGLEQGLDTYERTGDVGLSLLSAAIEGGVTTAFGAIKLGGTEDIGQALANPVMRQQLAKSVAKAWVDFGIGVGKTVGGEQLEELTISFLNDLAVESKANPNLTREDLVKNLRDTAVATLAAAGPMGALGSAREQGLDLLRTQETAAASLTLNAEESGATETAKAAKELAPEIISDEDRAFIAERKSEATKARRKNNEKLGPLGEGLNAIES